ncbi:MAG: hypothetical protein ABSE16_04270 [Verrucomicrobiota bacterium]|jgi:hypothetical protein
MPEFKFSCPNCGQHILCNAGYSGRQINCPACQQTITVPPVPGATAAPAPPPPPRGAAPSALGARQSTATAAAGQRFPGAGTPPRQKSGALKMVLTVTAALVVAAIGYFGVEFALHHVGAGKPKANPAAQVKAPTAAAAIQALSILGKMRSAYTNLTSVTADGTVSVFLSLSNLTLADVTPNLPDSAKQNANRHPPGMPRVLTNWTEITVKRGQSNWYYFAGEAKSKIDRMIIMTNTFAFWSSDQGRFIFSDSHRRVMPATYMQLPDLDPANNPAEQLEKLQRIFEDPAQLTKIAKDLGQTDDEPVNGQNCYTLTARVLGQKVKVWVDKNTYLATQWQITLGGAISDADIDDAFSLFATAFPGVPPAQLGPIKAQVKQVTPAMAKIRGVITSTSRNLEINPTLSADDFSYPVPPGVTLTRLPNMAAQARGTASLEVQQRYACINNLRQIDAAKNEWALEKGKPNGTPVAEDDIKPYIKLDADGNLPRCPAGGKYTIGNVGEKPTCSIPGHELP